MEKEDVKVGEILAHRCWWILRDHIDSNPNLRSFIGYFWRNTTDVIWLPNKVLTAVVGDYGSGIYSLKSRNAAINFRKYVFREHLVFPIVATGTVHIWGDIIEHERGYRSQYAKIAKIDCVHSKEGGVHKELTDYFKGLYNV